MKDNPKTNRNAPDERIDELLNSYIDDELTTEQKTEVESLIEQDSKIAQRMRQFQKCRTLVGSMPVAQAPASVLEGVKDSLAGMSLPVNMQQAETRYILVRKVLAAAAMVALAAVLSVVINKSVIQRDTSLESPTQMIASSAFSGRLELKTGSLAAVDAFIKNAIDDKGLSAAISSERRQGRRVYSISCSKEGLNSLLVDLDNVWSQVDSATLFVNTEDFAIQTVVDAVTTEQIARIAETDTYEQRTELAKDFSILNNIPEHMPDKEIRVAIESDQSDLTEQLDMLKPVLTSSQKSDKNPSDKLQQKQNISLTIILDW